MPIQDSFNRADSASSLGTLDTGQVWVPLAGTWGISSNRAYKPGNSTYDNCTVDAGAADGEVSASLPVLGSAFVGLCARLTDNSNYLVARYIGGGMLSLDRVQANVFTQLGTYTGFSAGDVLLVRCEGTAVTVLVNGTVRISVTSSFNQTATKFGLHSFNSDVRWDDFSLIVLPADWELVRRQLRLYTSRVNVYRQLQTLNPTTLKPTASAWRLIYADVPVLYTYTQNDSDMTGAGRLKRRSALTEDHLHAPVLAEIRDQDLVVDVTDDTADHRGANAGAVHRVMGQPRILPNAGARSANKRIYQLFTEDKPPALP